MWRSPIKCMMYVCVLRQLGVSGLQAQTTDTPAEEFLSDFQTLRNVSPHLPDPLAVGGF